MKWLPVIEANFQIVNRGSEEILCLCPWHPDKSGHLYINAVKGLYLCMSCGAKGSLDKRGGGGYDIPTLQASDVRARLREVTKREAKMHYYPEGWLRKFDVPHDYWESRGLTPEQIARWRLGYDPFSDRCTIPMRTMHGEIIGVSFRRLDGGAPKYLDPTGYKKGKHLYGAWLLRDEDVRTVALVEGQVDAITTDAARVPVVATMGSRLTRDQVRVLQSLGVRKVVAMYDNDNAGRKAVIQTYDMLRGSGIQFAAGWYRDYWMVRTDEGLKPAKDPGDLSGSRIRKMYHSALPILDWIERVGFKAD